METHFKTKTTKTLENTIEKQQKTLNNKNTKRINKVI